MNDIFLPQNAPSATAHTPSSVQPVPLEQTHEGKSVAQELTAKLAQRWNKFYTSLILSAEPRVHIRRDRNGHTQFEIRIPQTQQVVIVESETEALRWVEQRHRHPAPLPRLQCRSR